MTYSIIKILRRKINIEDLSSKSWLFKKKILSSMSWDFVKITVIAEGHSIQFFFYKKGHSKLRISTFDFPRKMRVYERGNKIFKSFHKIFSFCFIELRITRERMYREWEGRKERSWHMIIQLLQYIFYHNKFSNENFHSLKRQRNFWQFRYNFFSYSKMRAWGMNSHQFMLPVANLCRAIERNKKNSACLCRFKTWMA